jgi:Phage portal protein
MESSLQISLADRLRVAGRAIRGLFKQPTPQDLLGVYAGLFPGGPGSPPPRGMAELIKSYADMPWLHAVVGKIASGVASAEWKVFVVRNVDGEVKWRRDLQRADFRNRQQILAKLKKERRLEEVEDHPLPKILDESNAFVLGLTTRRLTQIYLELVGEGYWIKERNEFGMPISLWPLPPHWVTKPATPRKPFFEVKFLGWQGEIPASEIVWFVQPDPCDPYGRGIGFGKSLADELETDEYAAKHMKAFFYNRARPDIIVSGKGLRQTETQRLEQDWLNKLQGFWRTFKPYFISGEVKVDVISQNFEHLQLMELRKHSRDTVIQTEGIPPELHGIIENSNRATIDSADYLFARWVLVPRLEFLRATMQDRLVPDFDERLILDYCSPVQEDKEFNLKAAQAAPWSTMVDEWRELRGAEPLPNDQGKVFMVPFGLNPVPLRDTDTFVLPDLEIPNVDEPEDEEEEEEDKGAIEEMVTRSRLVDKGLKAGEIESLVMIQRIARRMTPEMRKAFLFAVNKAKNKMSVQEITAAFETRSASIVLSKVPLAEFEAAFGDKGEKVLKQTLKLAGDHAAKLLSKDLGLPVSFDLTNIRAVAWIRRNGAEMVTNVTDQTRAAIVQAIERAIIEGRPPAQAARDLVRLQVGLNKQQEKALAAFQAKLTEDGAPDIEKRVAKYAKALERQRSLSIARTETLNASNGGQQTLWLEAKDAGYLDPSKTEREWLVTDDDRLDVNVCEPMDGQKRGLEEPFITGDGRSVMHPAAHPSCRCSMRLRFKK